MNKSPSLIGHDTSIIGGGIRMPNVPETAVVPVAIDLEYPWSIMFGIAIRPSNTTDAPITPVEAARMIPITIIVLSDGNYTFL